MQLSAHLAALAEAENTLADACAEIAEAHHAEPDVARLSGHFADLGRAHVERLAGVRRRYGEADPGNAPSPVTAPPREARGAGAGLLWDLQDLVVRAALVEIAWTAVGQAAQALRDRDLLELTGTCVADTRSALGWLRTRIEQSAPQALIAATR